MQNIKQNLYSTTVLLLLLLSGCGHVPIHDEPFCSPIPDITGSSCGLGAACDNLLTSNAQVLTQDQWVALQSAWVTSGKAVECTTSTAVGDIKGEIEKLCSVAKCDVATKNMIIAALTKIQTVGDRTMAIATQNFIGPIQAE